MRYIKKFEDNKTYDKINYSEKFPRDWGIKPKKKDYLVYWSVLAEWFYFRAALRKVGCPEDDIIRLWEDIRFFPSVRRFFIRFNSKFSRWDISKYISPIENNGENALWRYGFTYKGSIKLSPEEIKQVNFERTAKKYNL
jgi:hypothetical protein